MKRSVALALGLLLTVLVFVAGWMLLRQASESSPGSGSIAGPLTADRDEGAAPDTEQVTYLIDDRASFRPADLAPDLTLALSQGEPVEIRVDTFTDTLLGPANSRAMTALWAGEVTELLALLGANPAIITATAHGEENLSIETGDGVAEIRNRRVVVTVAYE